MDCMGGIREIDFLVPSWGRSRFKAGMPEVWGVLIVCCFVIQEDVIAKLKEVTTCIIGSKVNEGPFVEAVLTVAGVIGSASPA